MVNVTQVDKNTVVITKESNTQRVESNFANNVLQVTTVKGVSLSPPSPSTVAYSNTYPGAGSGSSPISYTHIQSSASDIWTINHGLGYKPSITLFSVGGVEMEAEILHSSSIQALVYFNIPVAGTARCI